jgi:4-carboxymuconolactone decarboxylase
MMPRLTPITQRDQVAEDGRDSFDEIIASRGRINAPQSMLLYSPVLSARATAMNDALRELLSEADFELAVIAAAREFDIEYVWAAHAPTAVRAGVSEATVETIRTRGDLGGLTTHERVIVSLAREMVGGHRVSAETFEAARAELGERKLMEVIAAMGYYVMIGCVLIATDMELPAGASRLSR